MTHARTSVVLALVLVAGVAACGGGLSEPSPSPVTGRHARIVTASYRSEADAGAALSDATFTLVLDADAREAVLGSGSGQTSIVLDTSDGRTFRASTRFRLPGGGIGCGSEMDYATASFTVSEGAMTGEGHGDLITFAGGDYGASHPVTVSMTGLLDTQPPSLSGGGNTDPLVGFTLIASEPLPANSRLSLVSDSGDAIPLAAQLVAPGAALPAVRAFSKPDVVLRYGTVYRIVVDGMVDFAGNAADSSSEVTFTTNPVPPLLTEDGFESATATTLGGGQVVGDGWPVLAGGKSFYVPGRPGPVLGTPFALRLPVQPGDQVVHFSYRLVCPTAPCPSPLPGITLGFVGGSLSGAPMQAPTGSYSQQQLPDQTTVYVSASAEAEIPLPAGSASEVVFGQTETYFGCGLSPSWSAGLLIDDLRVEPAR